MTEYAGEIRSNLKRAVRSWDDEVMTSPSDEALLQAANLQMSDRASSANVLDEVHRLEEDAVGAAKGQRWEGQERWQGRENEEMRLVRVMHPHTVFERLRRAGVDARTESPEFDVWTVGGDGKPELRKVVRSTGRIWLSRESRVGRIGVMAYVPDQMTGRREIRQVTTLQYPYGPEWSLMRFNSVGVATDERYRGWRTAMLQMVLADVLTEREVERAFGPATGPASLHYREQMQGYRNRKAGLIA